MARSDFEVSIVDDIESSLKGFNKIFQEEKQNAMEVLARGAVTAWRNALDKATTQWGFKRMAGRSGNSVFAPYGRSAGRNDSGQMMDDLGYSVNVNGGNASVTVGWVENYEDYYGRQEEGFTSNTIFKGARNNSPRFGKSKIKMKIDGAHGMDYAYASFRKRKASFMSGAWNAALSRYKGKASPGSYLEARQNYYNSFTGDEVF